MIMIGDEQYAPSIGAVRASDDRLTRVLRLDDSDLRSKDPTALMKFVDALLAIPLMRHEPGRYLLMDYLRPEMADAILYFPQSRYHVFSMVRTCMNFPGGLAELLSLVRALEGGSTLLQRLDETVTELLASG
jgi:hypothetical protein